ncbi:MAG: DUF2784 domain-containing protein [Burkholderiales bacterium]
MLLLADLILVVHFLFVLFVVASLPLVWAGALAGWRWVRHRGFRFAHLAAILFVTAESLAGVWCPLTLWEDALRGTVQEKSFVARWIHALLYYDLPPAVFTVAYLLFAALVALTWWRIPPQRGRRAQ